MTHAEDAGSGRHIIRRRLVSEKLAIVRLTMEPGASVAEIARVHGVNANQVFKWRRLFERGQLGNGAGRATALLPVAMSAEIEAIAEPSGEAAVEPTPSGGAIHIELSGRANINVESGAEHPRQHLKNYSGALQADAYSVLHHLYGDGRIYEVSCWAHARRKFHDIHVTHQSPITTEALNRIGALYAIEDQVRGKPPDIRRSVRQDQATPILDDLPPLDGEDATLAVPQE